MGEKITEYSTETANAAQGGFTTVLGYFLNNEAYGEVFRRELEYARRARPRRLRLPFQHRQRAAHQGARRVRARLRRHLVQVLHELQGRGRALPRPGRHRRRLLLRSAQGIRARRAADHRLPHREHRDREPRAAQDPGRGRQHAQGLVRVEAGDHRVRAGAARHVPRRGARRARLLPAHLLAQGARRDPLLAQPLQGRHRRDLPALPHAHRGLRARRHGQGQPAVPHARTTRKRCGRRSSTAPSTSSPRITTRARR